MIFYQFSKVYLEFFLQRTSRWPLLFNVNLQYFIKSLLNALARPVTFSVERNHRFRVIRMILVKSFWQFLVLDISVNWEWEWKGQCQAGHKLLRRNTNYIKYVLTCKYQVITSKYECNIVKYACIGCSMVEQWMKKLYSFTWEVSTNFFNKDYTSNYTL